MRDRIIGALMECTVAELVNDRHDEPVAMPFAIGGIAIAGRRAVQGTVKDL